MTTHHRPSGVAVSTRPGRTHRARRAPAALAYRAPRPPRLAPGELRALVLAHLRTYPELDFTPRDLARVLGHCHGAIRAVCAHLVDDGVAHRTRSTPARFQAATP